MREVVDVAPGARERQLGPAAIKGNRPQHRRLCSSVLLMDLRLQRVGAWCGIVAIVLFLIFFGLLAGLIPPLSPTSNAQEIARFFVEHKLRVRLGVALALLSTCVALRSGRVHSR